MTRISTGDWSLEKLTLPCGLQSLTFAGSAAAARASCTSEGDIFVQVATRASHCVAKQVWPTLAPALVAPRLLGLLAHARAFLLVQVAARASPWVATQVGPTLATALVAPRLLGLLVRPMEIYLCKLRRGLHLEWQVVRPMGFTASFHRQLPHRSWRGAGG